MPVYVFWGEDDYRLRQAVQHLRQQVLNPDWTAFNFDHLPPEGLVQGLNQVMTAPFGLGDRLVWLEESKVMQQCPEEVYLELERTLTHLPSTNHLLITSSHKPDGRIKSTKLLKQSANWKEFSLLPAWDQDGILQQVKTAAKAYRLTLAGEAAELLATAVGNDPRKLDMELEKLALFTVGPSTAPISATQVQELVPNSAYNSFQLASALRQGQTDLALDILTHLLDQSEPALKILAVLVGQFRTWMWIKLLIEENIRDPATMAEMAEISNPKRLFFLQKEVQALSSTQVYETLGLLLELEWGLKQGQPEREAFEITILRISQLIGSKREAIVPNKIGTKNKLS